MHVWKYAHLYTLAGIRLDTSDPYLVDWAIQRLRTQDPSGKMSIWELHTGHKQTLTWYAKVIKEHMLADWLLSELLLNGWEPFQVDKGIEMGWFLRQAEDR
jgi:hypothetical protein